MVTLFQYNVLYYAISHYDLMEPLISLKPNAGVRQRTGTSGYKIAGNIGHDGKGPGKGKGSFLGL